MKKICLCMIVKNESAIIERCLNSAKPILDYVFIMDTGSTDGTQEIIQNWLKDNDIQGTVHEEAFQNFGYNRTAAVKLAKKKYPQADYLLILDADEELEISPQFKKNDLTGSGYITMQYNQHLKYWYHRLLGTAFEWYCVGVTHEFWTSNASTATEKLSTLVVKDYGDGGSKQDKFERDERLLLEALKDPNLSEGLRTRYLFYLANTYHDTHQCAKAIEWYEKRIQAGGWEEEVFYSYYRIGECYKKMAHVSKYPDRGKYIAMAVAAYNDAWDYRPERAEPLYEISHIYRVEGKNHLSVLYAQKAAKIPFPKNDVLFINYAVYDYLIDYELSISGYYVDKKMAKNKQKKLEKRTDLPESIRENVLSNSKYYGDV